MIDIFFKKYVYLFDKNKIYVKKIDFINQYLFLVKKVNELGEKNNGKILS